MSRYSELGLEHALSSLGKSRDLQHSATQSVTNHRIYFRQREQELQARIEEAFRTGYRAGADDTHEGRYDADFRWQEFPKGE